MPNSCLSIRESNPVALKALFSVSSGVFLLAIQKYWRVEETPDYLKTKAFRVLRSFKMSYFCRYKEKTKQCFRLARLFDAVTAKRGLFKTVLSSALLCLCRRGGGLRRNRYFAVYKKRIGFIAIYAR